MKAGGLARFVHLRCNPPLARQCAGESLGQNLLNKVIRSEMTERLRRQAASGAFQPTRRVGAQVRHGGGRVGGLIGEFTGPVREAGVHHFAFGGNSAPTGRRNRQGGGRIRPGVVKDRAAPLRRFYGDPLAQFQLQLAAREME